MRMVVRGISHTVNGAYVVGHKSAPVAFSRRMTPPAYQRNYINSLHEYYSSTIRPDSTYPSIRVRLAFLVKDAIT